MENNCNWRRRRRQYASPAGIGSHFPAPSNEMSHDLRTRAQAARDATPNEFCPPNPIHFFIRFFIHSKVAL